MRASSKTVEGERRRDTPFIWGREVKPAGDEKKIGHGWEPGKGICNTKLRESKGEAQKFAGIT